jgi:hypothetical protein
MSKLVIDKYGRLGHWVTLRDGRKVFIQSK